MKSGISQLVEQAIAALPELADAPEIASISTTVERTRDARHGDFTTNVAMRLAKAAGRNPREVAQVIIDKLPASELVSAVEIQSLVRSLEPTLAKPPEQYVLSESEDSEIGMMQQY